TAVNDAPVAQAQSVTTAQNTPISGTLVATDIDSPSLTYSIVASPAHGTVTINVNTGAYTYTPAAGYSGSDSFTFKANDGSLDSNVATVSLTVTPATNTYTFSGFLPPVSPNRAFKLGSTVPIKFQITDSSGHYVTSTTGVTLTISGPSGFTTLTITGSNGLRY